MVQPVALAAAPTLGLPEVVPTSEPGGASISVVQPAVPALAARPKAAGAGVMEPEAS